MRFLSRSLILGATALVVPFASAQAADYTPPPVVEAPDPVVPSISIGGNWYLRGDVGVSVIGKSAALSHATVTAAGGRFIKEDFGAAGMIGVGVGYRFNKWMRFDGTIEFRGSHSINAIDEYSFNCGALTSGSCSGGGTITRNNFWNANISSTVLMANAYADLGTYYGLTPFIGGGIGASYNFMSGVRDHDPSDLGGAGFGPDKGKWNFAWALSAGLGYEINERLTLEASYRYMHLGSAESGRMTCLPARTCNGNRLKVKNLRAHDMRLGMRWNFGETKKREIGYEYEYQTPIRKR